MMNWGQQFGGKPKWGAQFGGRPKTTTLAQQLPAKTAVTPPAIPPDTTLGTLEQYMHAPLTAGFGLQRPATDVEIGLGQFAHGLEAAPSRIGQTLAKYGAISPETAQAIPSPSPVDYAKKLGITDPNILDKLIQGAARYIPYGIAAAAAAPEALGGTLADILGGTAYGLTQTAHPLLGAITGAIGVPGIGLGIKMLGMGAKTIRPFLSKYAAKGYQKLLQNDFGGLKDISNTEAFNRSAANYQTNYLDKEDDAWNRLKKGVNTLDKTIRDQSIKGVYADKKAAPLMMVGEKQLEFPRLKSYDDRSYVNSLKNFRNKLIKQGKGQEGEGQPDIKRQNAMAIQNLQDWMDASHSTFSDAFNHNKNLNVAYKNALTPEPNIDFGAVKYAKRALAKNIDENIKNNGLENTLGQFWKNVNNLTQQKNQIFHEITTPRGTTIRSPFLNFFSKYTRGQPYSDPSSFVNSYVPASKAEGIMKMQQFSNMVGDDEIAKDALRKNYFGNSLGQDEINPKSFLNKYKKLSVEQKNYLFEPDQNTQLTEFSKILDKNPNILSKGRGAGIWRHSVGTLFGIGAAGELGAPWYTGAIAGMAAEKPLESAAEHIMSRRLLRRAAPSLVPKRIPTLADITGQLGVAPALTSYLGGQ